MYTVLDKETIKSEIMPHLSTAKREFITKKALEMNLHCSIVLHFFVHFSS